eukprot:tig00020510_g9877.t1
MAPGVHSDQAPALGAALAGAGASASESLPSLSSRARSARLRFGRSWRGAGAALRIVEPWPPALRSAVFALQ